MNREIKFRAWDGKKWQYGTYYYGVMYPTSFMGHYVNDEQIDENTLGQFTGLLDKNGKEIYEGDILKSKPYLFDGKYIVSQVIFDKAMWLAEEIDPKYSEREYLFEAIKEAHETEIIGNIHENQELLKI